MTPNPKKTTVLLLRQDSGGVPDPYLAFLETLPEMSAEVIEKLPEGIGGFVRLIRNLTPAPGGISGFSGDELRALLTTISARTRTTFDPELAGLGARARDLLDRFFPNPAERAVPQDLETYHSEAIPLLPGPGADEHAFGWLRWHADRARLALTSPLDPDIDILMGQLEDEGVEVEEAVEAIADLWERDGKPSHDVRVDGPWSA